ncbi:MAG: hypothetical protein M3010_12205 [Candidatus Dormibacteraeota bacterium]|nr:hypothetical protein [Candidatus Dormibacteraeota bacterium]
MGPGLRVAAILGTIAAMLSPGARTMPASAAAPAPAPVFAHPVTIDAQRLAGEPDITVAPDGRQYASAPWGVTTNTTFFWRSEDGGQQFRQLQALPGFQNPTLAQGSGDTELQAGSFVPPGGKARLFFVNQEDLVTNQCGYSDDAGRSFVNVPYCPNLQGADRQWVAVSPVNPSASASGGSLGHDMTYLWYDTVSTGDQFFHSDDGVTYTGPAVLNNLPAIVGNPGNTVADRRSGAVYVTVPDSDTSGKQGVAVGYSVDGGATLNFVQAVPFRTAVSTATDFSVLAIDSAGGLYLVFSQQMVAGQPWQPFITHTTATSPIPSGPPARRTVEVAGASPAQWSTPVPLTGPGSGRPDITYSVFPWITAGDPGRVDIAFYGTAMPLTYDPNSQDARWSTYVSQSLNALTAAPTFSTVSAAEGPTHLHSICFNGIGCSGTGNRNMLDFFEVQHDALGAAVVIYNDDANTLLAKFPGGPFDTVARQVGGPSLFAAVGSLDGAPTPDTPFVRDRAGDGLLPTSDVNVPSLDLLGAGAALDGTTLNVSFRVADLSSPATSLPPAELASGADAVTYLLTWKWHDDVWFAAAKVDLAGQWQFLAGRPQGVPFTGTGGPKIAAYTLGPNSSTVPGSVDAAAGTINIAVPTAAVGGVGAGQRLLQATGFSLADRVVPIAGQVEAVPLADQADVTPSFDDLLGGATTRVPVGPPRPVGSGDTGTPNTSGRRTTAVVQFLAVGVAGAAAAWLVGRRRRRPQRNGG